MKTPHQTEPSNGHAWQRYANSSFQMEVILEELNEGVIIVDD
jgi:hypothetical protein